MGKIYNKFNILLLAADAVASRKRLDKDFLTVATVMVL
mgnify:FL=1